MEAAIMAALTAMLQVVDGVLPVVGAETSTPIIITIVTALEKWVPLVIAMFPSATNLYQAIKNIIASLSSNPATPADQLASLQQLDAQADTAFESAATALNPATSTIPSS
jgi:hypothetical protein